jgi:N-dimethylarginine dimethylaminohydrolase
MNSILLCSPQHFNIKDTKNPYMNAENLPDVHLAQQQWDALYQLYKTLEHQKHLKEVCVLNPIEGLEDMVFCANQTFPFLDKEGNKHVIISNMKHISRQREVPYFEQFFREKGYQIHTLPLEYRFEGMGDLILHNHTLFGGYGYRTNKNVYTYIEKVTQRHVVLLELKNPYFYHLDTCFLPLYDNTLLLVKEAFTNKDIEKLKLYFTELIFIPEQEAKLYFSLNAHVFTSPITQKHFAILQKGDTLTKSILKQKNYAVFEIDTSEFMKSGGSIFCMKMAYKQ